MIFGNKPVDVSVRLRGDHKGPLNKERRKYTHNRNRRTVFLSDPSQLTRLFGAYLWWLCRRFYGNEASGLH